LLEIKETIIYLFNLDYFVLKKLNIRGAEKISKKFSGKMYVHNPFWLAFAGFWEERNGEELISERDEIYPNDFPYIHVPAKEINLKNAIISWVTESELNSIKKKVEIINSFPIGEEYYYETTNILDLNGKDKKDFRRNINVFKKKYNHKVFSDYPKKRVIEFIEKWAKNQKDKNDLFEISKEFAIFCVENMNKFKHVKWIFVEIDGKLAGFNLSVKFNNEYWVGVHQKVDYGYDGIGRFLFLLRAEAFKNVKYFTLGTGARDEGITYFKRHLNPIRVEKRYYVVTGAKLS